MEHNCEFIRNDGNFRPFQKTVIFSLSMTMILGNTQQEQGQELELER